MLQKLHAKLVARGRPILYGWCLSYQKEIGDKSLKFQKISLNNKFYPKIAQNNER